QSARSTPLGAEELFAALSAEESMFSALPAVTHLAGSEPFDVLVGNLPTGTTLPPPPAVAEELPPEVERVSAEARDRALEASSAAEERGDYAEALTQLRIALRSDARDTKSLARALLLFELCDKPDGRWNAACALELLGGANEAELDLAASHRPEGLLPAHG